MILLVHMVFGAAVGYTTYSLSNNIWLAVLLALLSHYFLDLFPHVEYLKSTEDSVRKIKNQKLKDYFPDVVKVVLDVCLGIFLLLLFPKNHLLIYICAFLAIVPDGLTVINSLFDINILKKHHEFHGGRMHYLTKNKKFPLFWRIFTQVLALLIGSILLKI